MSENIINLIVYQPKIKEKVLYGKCNYAILPKEGTLPCDCGMGNHVLTVQLNRAQTDLF